ncbi:MAG: protein kinase, partial [Deltaproteobacteria bacterium]|nr:protein kinase [Deltaproteobacteria bacterium]
GVFIAMELVEGSSLAAWFNARTPPWREILRKYIDAGRGLAAAHAAGVIHRDFKPENVLVGEDGRVRVGDFGLAGGPAALDEGSEESQLDRDTGNVHGPAGSLTQTGALLGTPKYMAPEQESGALANARSDQFSFCVALYEALYGYPPFAGDSVAEYRHSVRHGRVLDPPPESKVRAWVHSEVVRGLGVDPVDRHPGLTPLLDRLEEALVDPSAARRRRRRLRGIAVVGTIVGLLAVSGTAVWMASGADDPTPQPAAFERDSATVARAQPSPTTPGLVAAADDGGPAEVAPLRPTPEATTTSDQAATPNDQAATPHKAATTPKGEGSTPTPSDAAPPDAAVPDPATPDPAVRRSTPPTTDGAAAPTHGKAPARRKRKTGTCYFQQDKFNYLQRTRRHSRYIQGTDDRCYDCNDPAPDYRLAQLSPSDCARYYLCVAVAEDRCAP